MSKIGITQDDVFKVANEIASTGIMLCIPTIIDHRFRFHIVTHKLKNAVKCEQLYY
jgi:hypothetical protein